MVLEEQFDHKKAQEFELEVNELWINENFQSLYAEMEDARVRGEHWPGRGELNANGFYAGSRQTWENLAADIENRTCLEVGPGPCGALAGWWWVKRRIFIDPLVEEYRRISLKAFNKTWYTDDLELYAQPAEILIPDLVGNIDGVIVCRNALDHCADPIRVLKNIAAYAAPGCILLLWTDLWHLLGHDEGHRNITQDKAGFEDMVRGFGFEILYSFSDIRKDGSTIEYGCRARKINTVPSSEELGIGKIAPSIDPKPEYPLVSVGLPVYNRPALLIQALNSLLKQTYKNLEIIISEDCSPTDETKKVVHAFMAKDPRIKYFHQGKNLGAVGNHRFVFEQSTGDFYFWASEDDEWHESFVEIGVKTLLENPRYGAWCCTMNNTDTFGRVIREYPSFSRFTSTHSKTKDIVRYLMEPEVMGKSNIYHGIFRREALRKTIQKFHISDIWGSDYCFNLAFLTKYDLIGTDRVLHYKRVTRPTDNPGLIHPIVIVDPSRHIFPLEETGRYLLENIRAARFSVYLGLVVVTMISRIPVALRNESKTYQAILKFFGRMFPDKTTQTPLKAPLLRVGPSPYDFVWPEEFEFKSSKKAIDVRWGTVQTYGIIRVPLDNLRAPLLTSSGKRLFKIQDTPHYQWIQALMDKRYDQFIRNTYREYIATYFPEGKLMELEEVPRLVESFRSQGDIPITIVTLPPALDANSDIYVMVYDGVHRAAIAKALGHQYIQCRLVSDSSVH